MFFPYSLSDYSAKEQQRLAALRNEMEPLAEILQVKGDSECRNGLSRVLGQPDEYCNFEKLRLPEEASRRLSGFRRQPRHVTARLRVALELRALWFDGRLARGKAIGRKLF